MSPRFVHTVEIVAARGEGQDRARVTEAGEALVIALADGAGGVAGGAIAAQAIVDAATLATADCAALLADLDRDRARLGHGQSTAVLLIASSAGISGASVGDSGAWLIDGSEILDLTEGQTRKPLVGAGCAPFRVTASRLGHRTLLVASDGLLRYAKPRDIARLALTPDLSAGARALVDLVRLPNGVLQDDVSIVLCRERSA